MKLRPSTSAPGTHRIERASLAQPQLLGQLFGLLRGHVLELPEEPYVERDVIPVGHVVDEELVAVAREHHDQFGAGTATRGMDALNGLVGDRPGRQLET